jgi:hypothetical protein
MQVDLDFLQMSLLVVGFFCTPISLLYTCHIPFRKNSMSNILKSSAICSFGGQSGGGQTWRWAAWGWAGLFWRGAELLFW